MRPTIKTPTRRQSGSDVNLEELQTEGQYLAARSLTEGMEETLTLHRLGVGKQLRRSLRTTNIMEHLNSQINESLRRIKH